MSSSSSKSQQQSSQQDNRATADNQSTIVSGAGGNVTINQSDAGLIATAFDYFTKRDALQTDLQGQLVGATTSAFNEVMAGGNALLSQAAVAADPAAMQRRFEYVLMAVVALFFLFPKGVKA